MGEVVVKRVLMIAYHYPPMRASSGFQRTLRFSEYLPEHGWQPSVLTVHPRAYPGQPPEDPSAGTAAPAPGSDGVCRAFALDTARHLSLFGRYPQWLGTPDRWWSWWLGAVPAGLAMIRRQKPDVLWSTYPIATAHAIGHTLHRLTGIPWVADFRDPMAQDGYPAEPSVHRAFEQIERRTLDGCARAVFTTAGTMGLYAERYPHVPRERLVVIENGYDEAAFAAAASAGEKAEEPALRERGARNGSDSHGASNGHGERGTQHGPLVLVHSGTVYASERDPRSFFAALAGLRRSGQIGPESLRVVLRATGCDDYLREILAGLGIDDIVTLAPPVGYREALAEMLAADGLLVLQAANCNFQVPAKLYEYLRARRPILALTDEAGDTARTLREAGIDTIAPLDSETQIATALVRFIGLVRDGRAPISDAARIAAASRRSRTAELARELEAVA